MRASRIELMKHVKENEKHDEVAHAGFRSGVAAGQPSRSGERGIRKMSLKDDATVRNGIEKLFPKIEACMHAHRKPQISGPAQREAPKQTCQYNSRYAQLALARICDVHQ